MMAADRLKADRDYVWRGARRIILRSGDIAVRNTPAAGRSACACVLVTSDGIGRTGRFGGTVPSFVTDGSGGAVRCFVTSDGIGGIDGFDGAVPLGDGRGRVVAGPGSGRGAAGSGMMSSLGTSGPPQHPQRPLAGRRPERCEGEHVDARDAIRRPAGPASAAGSRGG